MLIYFRLSGRIESGTYSWENVLQLQQAQLFQSRIKNHWLHTEGTSRAHSWFQLLSFQASSLQTQLPSSEKSIGLKNALLFSFPAPTYWHRLPTFLYQHQSHLSKSCIVPFLFLISDSCSRRDITNKIRICSFGKSCACILNSFLYLTCIWDKALCVSLAKVTSHPHYLHQLCLTKL